MTTRPAIVVGGYLNGLGLVRALWGLNQRIIVITTMSYDMAHHSKYVCEHHHISRLDQQPERLVELLKNHAEQWVGAVIIPTNDEAIASLSMYRDVLEKWYKLVLPPTDSIPYLLNKKRMLNDAENLGITIKK